MRREKRGRQIFLFLRSRACRGGTASRLLLELEKEKRDKNKTEGKGITEFLLTRKRERGSEKFTWRRDGRVSSIHPGKWCPKEIRQETTMS